MMGRHDLYLQHRLRPAEEVSVHLEECITSEVRVCSKKGTSYSPPLACSSRSRRSDVSGFCVDRRIH